MNQTVRKPAKIKIGWALMRVSTKQQAEVQHGSLEQQRHMLERWSAQQSESVGQIYQITRFFEEDISGRGKAIHKRMALIEIERAIDTKSIDFIVFEKVDRLARDMIYNLGLVKKASENGIEVHEFESGKIDLRDRGSRLGFNIKNLLAEEYSLDLEEKITKKQREARINNGKDTSTFPVLGLDRHPSKVGMYVINKKEQAIVIDIFKKFIECGSITELSKYCNQKGYANKARMTKEKIDKNGNIIPPKQVGGNRLDLKTLRTLLSHPKLRGYSFFKDTWNQFPKLQDENGMVKWEYPHGAVVPMDLFKKAEDILEKNKKYNCRLAGNVYFISGMLFYEDGTKFTGAGAKNGEYQYYHCREKKFRIAKDKIEKVIINRVKEYLNNSELLQKLIGESKSMTHMGVPILQEEVGELRAKIGENRKIVDGFSNYIRQAALKTPENLEAVIRTIGQERDKAETELMVYERDLAHKESRLRELKEKNQEKEMKDYLAQVLENFDNQTDIKKREVIRSILAKIVVRKENKLEIWIRDDRGARTLDAQNRCATESDFGHTSASYSAGAEHGTSEKSQFFVYGGSSQPKLQSRIGG